MSNQFENEIMIPEEMRQEAIAELSDEELAAIAGGVAPDPNHPFIKFGRFIGRLGRIPANVNQLRLRR